MIALVEFARLLGLGAVSIGLAFYLAEARHAWRSKPTQRRFKRTDDERADYENHGHE